MKKRILALTLVLCMLLPVLPLSALAASTAPTVDGIYYDSEYARDVVFGVVPVLDWYTGQAGTKYQENFDNGKLALDTDYVSFMNTVDTMMGYGDIITDRDDLVENFSAEIYDKVPLDVVNAMNYSVANGYITRDVLGMAREHKDKPYNEVQYMYAYYLDPTKEAGYDGPTNLPKIMVTTGEQSDEKGSMYGFYYFLQDLLYNTESSPVLEYLRHNVILIAVPCLSPGGINQNTYWNANYVNINRNFDADFLQTGGYDFVEDVNGEWVASKNGSGKTIYVKAEDGKGTHTPIVKADGLFSVDGSTIVGNSSIYSQNSGWAPFDQPESCAVRDLIIKNPDIFYYVDFHTFTSGPVPLSSNSTVQWDKMNWHSLSGTEGDAYSASLLKAANRLVDCVTEHFYADYNLGDYGCPADQPLGSITQDEGNGWQKNWALKNGVLASVIEGTSGFPKTAAYPNGILGGRYSPACQKANSELIGNWLIQVLAEYAYNGNVPTKTYTTTFAPYLGNYPTLGGLSLLPTGKYDLTDLPAVSVGTALPGEQYPLTYQNNWTVGYKTITAVGDFDDNPDNFTLFDEVWQYPGAADKPLYITDSHGLWATHGGLGFMQTNRNNMATAGTNGTFLADTTIRYTAEGSGKIVIDVTDLSFYSNVFQLVILKNGVEIGSIRSTAKTSDLWYDTEAGKWKTTGTTAALSGSFTTTVQAGDHIDFVNHLVVDDTLKALVADWSTNKENVRRGVDSFNFSISYYWSAVDTVTATYSGKDDALNSTHPAGASGLLPLVKWYNEGSSTAVAFGASVANATARINEDLIKAGWIKKTDTWLEAVEGYKNYLRSLSTVTSVSGWMPGALEADGNPFTAGNTFSPLTKATLFTSSDGTYNIFSANTNTGVCKTPYSCSMTLLVSEQYFEAQLERFCQAAEYVTVSGTAETIVIPYSAIAGKSMPIVSGANGGQGGDYSKLATGVAFVDRNATGCTETMLRTHYAENHSGTKLAAIGYTVPSGVVGLATLTLDAIYYDANGGRNDHQFALYHNGKALINWTNVTLANELTTIQAALKELGSFSVSAGDRIELRFRVSGNPFRVSPAVTLTIEQEESYTSSWDGTTAGVSKTQPTSFQPLFRWYDAATVTDPSAIVNGTAHKTSGITGTNYAVINPWLILNGWIDAEDTYGEAVEKYKVYLRHVVDIHSVNAWQVGSLIYPGKPYAYGLDATTFSKISDLAFLSGSNCYGIQVTSSNGSYVYGTSVKSGVGAQVWVEEEHFEEMISMYCLDYYTLQNDGYRKVTLEDGDVDLVDRTMKIADFTTTTLTYADLATQQEALGAAPVPWGPTSGSGRMYTSNEETVVVYNGVMLRPNIGGAMALSYVVPDGVNGTATLTLDSLTYGNRGADTLRNNPFYWKIMVNGQNKTEWALYTPTGNEVAHTPYKEAEGLASINDVLKGLSLTVRGGDRIEFCIGFYQVSSYVSPAMHIDVARTSGQAMRRVQYASGSKIEKSELVTVGSSLSDLIAAYRKTDADFAVNGCYVNGVWYDASAELPEIGMDNVVLDDFKMEISVSVGIGATYTTNVYLSALDGASEAGVYIHGKKLPATLQENGTWRVVVNMVYAKDVLDANVICTPYYVVDGEEAVCAKYTLIRMKDLLAEYIAGDYATADKALAQAALDYATVAKAYFAKETAPADVLSRLAACDGAISADKAATVITPGEKYTFTAASLQIGDTINFVLAIGNKDGSNLTSLDETLTIDGTTLSVTEFRSTSIKGQKMMAAVITGVPESKFAESLTFRLADATLVYSVKDYCVRTFASAQEAEKNMIRAVYAIGAAASGEHIHYYGDPTLVYEGGEPTKETVTCLYGNCGEQLTRPIPTLTMEYQDEVTFATPVLGIERENVTSTVTGTTTRDANVLVAENGCSVYATGVGEAYVRTQTGYCKVNVTPAVINMLFLSGQSNAEGAPAAEKNDDYASLMKDPSLYDYDDYAKFYKRSPDRMAYYTRTDHSLDITGAGTSTSDYTPDMYVVKTLKWGSQARYSNVIWRGVEVDSLCKTEGNPGGIGVCGGLASEWVEQTGERVWIINSSHGGHPIQNFLPIGTEGTLYNPEVPEARYNDYEQAVAVYQLALQTMQNEIDAGHFTLNHMVFYWFQGESDNSSTDAYYMECFERLYSELQKDVKLGDKTLDFAGLFTVRSCKDNQGNSRAELQMTATRLADYEMAASQSEIFDNVYCVTNATERWTGEDANVEEYFLDVYGSAENFEAIFGYPMPTKLGQMHPNIHYAIYGQNEMGVDAARNSLMILNDLYGAEYDLSYADLDATTKVTLVNYDGYTPATEVILSDSKEYGYVIPMVTPLYRMAHGVTLSVDAASGFAFDGFRIYVQEGVSRNDLASKIDVTVHVGEEVVGTYTLDVVFATTTYLDGVKTMTQYGNSQNPARQEIVIQESVWLYGYVDYTDGSYHEFDYYDESNGWYYTAGDKLWGDYAGSGGTFHGAYHSSQGIALANTAGSGFGVAYRVSASGVITPCFETFDANANDMDFAIFVNGVCVWPAVGTDYDDHTNWYHIYNGDADNETATTVATLNQLLANVEIQVKAGDLVEFVFEYVDGRTKSTMGACICYVKEES